jgi:hypothetical protein
VTLRVDYVTCVRLLRGASDGQMRAVASLLADSGLARLLALLAAPPGDVERAVGLTASSACKQASCNPDGGIVNPLLLPAQQGAVSPDIWTALSHPNAGAPVHALDAEWVGFSDASNMGVATTTTVVATPMAMAWLDTPFSAPSAVMHRTSCTHHVRCPMLMLPQLASTGAQLAQVPPIFRLDLMAPQVNRSSTDDNNTLSMPPAGSGGNTDLEATADFQNPGSDLHCALALMQAHNQSRNPAHHALPQNPPSERCATLDEHFVTDQRNSKQQPVSLSTLAAQYFSSAAPDVSQAAAVLQSAEQDIGTAHRAMGPGSTSSAAVAAEAEAAGTPFTSQSLQRLTPAMVPSSTSAPPAASTLQVTGYAVAISPAPSNHPSTTNMPAPRGRAGAAGASCFLPAPEWPCSAACDEAQAYHDARCPSQLSSTGCARTCGPGGATSSGGVLRGGRLHGAWAARPCDSECGSSGGGDGNSNGMWDMRQALQGARTWEPRGHGPARTLGDAASDSSASASLYVKGLPAGRCSCIRDSPAPTSAYSVCLEEHR